MKPIQAWILAAALVPGGAFGDDLTKEIDAWKPGQEVPHRLLAYPDGNVESHSGECYFSSNEAAVEMYIEQIKNDALLEELVFDHRSESASFHYALIKLIERKGLSWVASKLATREPTRWEHGVVKQLLRARHVRVSVATIEPSRMSRANALKALRKLKARLDSGRSWEAAYEEVADENPDLEKRTKEPGSHSTLVTYLFDGWLAEDGFAVLEMNVNPYLPRQHVKRIVASQKGAQIIEGPDQIYVYFISELYEPGA